MNWLPAAGIPNVSVCFKPSNKTAKCPESDVRIYPYYLADNYDGLWRRYQQKLHDFVKSLPTELAQRVQTVQVSLGSTGDITPWHGPPLDPKYAITSDQWKSFWVNGSLAMVEIWRDLVPQTKLLFNGVPPVNATPTQQPWPEYRHVIFDVLGVPNFDIKLGVLSHQYFTTNELDDWTNQGTLVRTQHIDSTTGMPSFVRARGEMSDGSDSGGPGKDFWNSPTWNLMAMMCWDLTFGLDIVNPNPQVWSREYGTKEWSPTLWTAFNHFHIYAGRKVASESPGAWLQLRDALDSSDTTRFSEAEFGPANLTNAKRMKVIAAKFADKGAVIEDIDAATSERHASRDRKGINDVGWRIWPTNYGQYLTQINPGGTSIGRWRVGPATGVLGNYARSTDTANDKSKMSFAVQDGVFAANITTLHIRTAFWDEGDGGWELSLTADGQSTPSSIAKVQKGDSQVWVEVQVTAPATTTKGLVLHLTDTDAPADSSAAVDDDVFAWLEVSKLPFAFNLTDRVVLL
jgi:hypothetical protein